MSKGGESSAKRRNVASTKALRLKERYIQKICHTQNKQIAFIKKKLFAMVKKNASDLL